MTHIKKLLVSAFVVLCLVAARAAAADGDGRAELRNWPAWRGPLGTGVAPGGDPPVEWSDRDGTNIRWKTALPGRGHSTPIVWGDRVFVTAAVPIGKALPPRYSQAPGAHDNVPVTHRHEFLAIALDRATGQILWRTALREALPHEGHHNTGSLASNSAVTDGQHVYVFFGSYGLYCLDFEGVERWRADFGLMQPLHGHGEGSSPALYGDTLIINWDHEGKSFVAALDKASGHERWRVARDEVTSWASPIVVEHAGRPQVIVSGTNRMRGYDLATGAVVWECGGLSSNVVASPVYGDGMVFAGSSYEKRALLALRLEGARGDITGTNKVAWTRNRSTPYVPSPLLYGDSLYFLGHYQGMLTRVDARTGKDRPGTLRLAGIEDVYASPVAAAGRLFVTDRNGTTVVVSHAEKPKVMAENRLEDRVNASASIAGRELFLRGERYLYCIANQLR
ncbi:MAG TPA: PQQ-binding-like beta-propeller repeat protein [Planctomycetaceae bacterium]|nr:PQQ-binding-like beta-propeller repeat protein [Planctomycetaceae bacterium]